MGLIDFVYGRSTPRSSRKSGGSKKPKQSGLGCEFCPRNNVPGIRKILGSVRGKRLMVWAQSPGPDENSEGIELIGKAGRWFWDQMGRAGLKREEDCDIQNVVRCLPADRETNRWILRDPTKEELRCCSIYNKSAIEKSKAKIWIVLGKIAANQLFGAGKKDPVFYFGDVRVYILDHPSYFIRGFAQRHRLEQFQKHLKSIKKELSQKEDRFEILRKQDYKGVFSYIDAISVGKELLLEAKNGNRISWDVEWDVVDDQIVLISAAASSKPGKARVFIMDHPQNPASPKDRLGVKKVVRELWKHRHKKTLHAGANDAKEVKKCLGVDIDGFDYDTNYGTYIFDPSQRTYKLSAIVARMLPEFAGYKDIILKEAIPEGMTVEEAIENRAFRMSKVSIKNLILYNGGDADVTKRVEMITKDHVHVPKPLVRIYTEVSFILDEMESFGPLLDYKQAERLKNVYPNKKDQEVQRLRTLVGDPDLNLNSQPQIVRVIYDTWKIPPIVDFKGNELRDTAKETLELMQVRKKHTGITILQDYRESKNRIERIDAFLRSANAHAGRISTYWGLTGARTGRMSSGGGTKNNKEDFTNLQNVPSDNHIKNLMISSLEWRRFIDIADRRGVRAALRLLDQLEVFIAIDYSQMEMRIMAQAANDDELIRIFQSGEDVHCAIGSIWTGWSYEDIKKDKDKRRLVKAFHFSVIYGKNIPSLHQDLVAQGIKVSLQKVSEYHTNYFRAMDDVRTFIDSQPDFVLEHGYVENILGFRVPIDADPNRAEKGGFWKNQAVNSPIQGAAHQVLLGCIALLRRNREKYRLIRPQLEIHDALYTISKIRDIKPTLDILVPLLEKEGPEMIAEEFGVDWKIPFAAGVDIGFRVGGLIEIEDPMNFSLEETFEAIFEKTKKQDKELEELEKKYAKVT